MHQRGVLNLAGERLSYASKPKGFNLQSVLSRSLSRQPGDPVPLFQHIGSVRAVPSTWPVEVRASPAARRPRCRRRAARRSCSASRAVSAPRAHCYTEASAYRRSSARTGSQSGDGRTLSSALPLSGIGCVRRSLPGAGSRRHWSGAGPSTLALSPGRMIAQEKQTRASSSAVARPSPLSGDVPVRASGRRRLL